jgi:non-heme chloroperoxidase
MSRIRRRGLIAAASGLLLTRKNAAAIERPTQRRVVNRINSSDGTPLHVLDWGEGPVIVFVHAWGLNAAMWEYPMASLAESGHRVVAFDRRGHGCSPDPGRGYDYDTLADDLAAVMDGLGLLDATLVGHSMGCVEIATYLARHGSSRGARVVFVSSPGPKPQGALIEPFLAGLRQDRPGFLANGLKLFTGTTITSGSPMARWVESLFLQTSPRALRECLRTALSSSMAEAASALRLRTLLIHGSADAFNPLDSTAAATARLIPSSNLLVVESAPHGLPVTHHARLTSELLAFVGPS